MSPAYPSDVTDAEWDLLSPLLPPAKPGGQPPLGGSAPHRDRHRRRSKDHERLCTTAEALISLVGIRLLARLMRV